MAPTNKFCVLFLVLLSLQFITSWLVEPTHASDKVQGAGFDPAPVRIPEIQKTAKRTITSLNLVQLRENEGLSLSPDGRYVAFVVGEAVCATNSYRSGLFVIATEPGSTPVSLGTAGYPDWDDINQWIPEAPRWSADSRFIFRRMRRSKSDHLQLWQWSREGGQPTQLTHLPGDVLSYQLTPDSKQLVLNVTIETDPADTDGASENAVLYDGNFQPWQGRRVADEIKENQPNATETWMYEIASMGVRKATTEETAMFGPWQSDLAEKNFVTGGGFQGHHVLESKKSPNGETVAYLFLVDDPKESKQSTVRLFVKPVRGGEPIGLASNIIDYWWSRKGERIFFTQSGLNGHSRKLKVVSSRGGNPTDVFAMPTGEWFADCSLDANESRLACSHENNVTPQEIVLVDVLHGTVRPLVELNPEFRNIILSSPVRMEGKNSLGDAWYGYLIKPLDYVPGTRYPLIITTYRTGDYFLRGASGNENPIQVYAKNGFAVLSVDVGQNPNAGPGDFDTKLLTWTSPTASLAAEIQTLDRTGIIDPEKVGISGYSHGSEIVGFAISHTALFHAAIGAGGYDPYFFYMAGSEWHDLFARWGVGGWPEGPAKARWQILSPVLNADRINTPLLNEEADTEYLPYLALETSLEQLRKPAELWIYPDELHVRNQPRHLYEIYNRNLDWYSFWLRNFEDADPAKTQQYVRWHELRRLQDESGSAQN